MLFRIWGPPGIGKTAMVQAVADAMGAHLETLILSTRDPGEVLGLHLPYDGVVRFCAAPWVRRLESALNAGRPALLFLDELSAAAPATQAALLRVVHERRVDEVNLEGIRVVAAANPADTAAAEGYLSPAAANRWLHIDYTPDAGRWVRGQAGGWGRKAGATPADAFVASWIRHRPQALLAVPEKDDQRERGWPSPRAWSAVARLLTAIGGDPTRAISDPVAILGVSGLVGSGAASELSTWAASLDLPDPEALLDGRAKLPKRGDQILAATMAAVVAATSPHQNRRGRISALWGILSKVRPDLAVTAAAALLDADPDGVISQEAAALGDQIISIRGRMS